MKKQSIAVLFGGQSEEYPISLKSAYEILSHIDREQYQPVPVGITRGGEWLLYTGPLGAILADEWRAAAAGPVTLAPGRLLTPAGPLAPDAVLPVLHGKFGEDGCVQGALELFGLRYAGCGVQSSAICMDKARAHRMAERAGVPGPWFVELFPGDGVDETRLPYPVFVKPARSGSSFGVTRVDAPEGLAAAIADARKYDGRVLIEQAVDGFEVGCALLGGADAPFAGEIDQIALSGGFFRIHQEARPEQGSENATIHVPARLNEGEKARIRAAAIAVYRALGCDGIARVDLFYTSDGRVLLNEVNTMPGFASYSRYPRMMAAAGVPLAQVVSRLLEYTLKK